MGAASSSKPVRFGYWRAGDDPSAPVHGRIECPKLATGFRQTLRLTREQWAAVARCACAGWWGDASGAPSRRAASVEVEASRPAAPAGRGGSTAADAERRHVQASARIEKRERYLAATGNVHAKRRAADAAALASAGLPCSSVEGCAAPSVVVVDPLAFERYAVNGRPGAARDGLCADHWARVRPVAGTVAVGTVAGELPAGAAASGTSEGGGDGGGAGDGGGWRGRRAGRRRVAGAAEGSEVRR